MPNFLKTIIQWNLSNASMEVLVKNFDVEVYHKVIMKLCIYILPAMKDTLLCGGFKQALLICIYIL